MAHTTIQERGYCSAGGYDRVDDVLRSLCDLYNAALEERIGCYRTTGRAVTAFDQYKSLTEIRRDDPLGYGALDAGVARSPIARLDKAMNAFFRRLRQGETPGFARFRSRRRYACIDILMPRKRMLRRSGSHWKLIVKGLPPITIKPGRALPDAVPKAIRIVRRVTGVTVDLVYEVDREPLAPVAARVGIDMGVRKRMTLSTGEIIKRADVDREAVEEQSRRLSKARKGSARRTRERLRLIRMRRRQAVRNRNACHRITTDLVRRFGVIAVEKLNIDAMTRSASGTLEEPGTQVAAKSGLNRSIMEQTWGLLLSQLRYKAEWAGREVVEVPARNTSRDCSRCGARNDPGTSERYRCTACGASVDRDLNAAPNILRAGNLALAGREPAERCGEVPRHSHA